MQKKTYASFGIVGPIVVYLSIGVSIVFSPWFSWQRNALSDLGHAMKSEVAPIFSLGLLLAGLLIIIYAVTIFKEHAKYTSICLVASAFLLQLVATFDESIDRFIISFGIWILYGIRVYSAGIAIPEIISFTAVASLLMLSAIRIYSEK